MSVYSPVHQCLSSIITPRPRQLGQVRARYYALLHATWKGQSLGAPGELGHRPSSPRFAQTASRRFRTPQLYCGMRKHRSRLCFTINVAAH